MHVLIICGYELDCWNRLVLIIVRKHLHFYMNDSKEIHIINKWSHCMTIIWGSLIYRELFLRKYCIIYKYWKLYYLCYIINYSNNSHIYCIYISKVHGIACFTINIIKNMNKQSRYNAPFNMVIFFLIPTLVLYECQVTNVIMPNQFLWVLSFLEIYQCS